MKGRIIPGFGGSPENTYGGAKQYIHNRYSRGLEMAVNIKNNFPKFLA